MDKEDRSEQRARLTLLGRLYEITGGSTDQIVDLAAEAERKGMHAGEAAAALRYLEREGFVGRVQDGVGHTLTTRGMRAIEESGAAAARRSEINFQELNIGGTISGSSFKRDPGGIPRTGTIRESGEQHGFWRNPWVVGIGTAVISAVVVGVFRLDQLPSRMDRPDSGDPPQTESPSESPFTPPSEPPHSRNAIPYSAITDETGTLRVQVPQTWSHLRPEGWIGDRYPPLRGRIGPGLVAATDTSAWATDLSVPGMFVGVSSRLVKHYDPAAVLNATGFTACKSTPRTVVPRGLAETWTSCAGTSTEWYQQAQWTEDRSAIVLVQVKIVDERDRLARDRIIQTLEVLALPPA